MTSARKITLGGREFDLRPLDFDHLQDALGHINQANPLTVDGLKELRRVVEIALDGQVTAEGLGKLPVSLDELFVAQTEIAEVSGLRPLLKRLDALAAERRSTGTSSTPPSPPTPAGLSPTSES